MNSNYLLNFVIPQGPTGPVGPTGVTGPTGPSNGLSVYGGRYSNTSQALNLTIGSEKQIPLATTLPGNNVNYTHSNSITVLQDGIYEISYYSIISSTVATTLTMAIRNNGTNIPSTVIYRTLSTGGNSIFYGNTIVNLSNGNVIDMAVLSTVEHSINLGSGVNSSIIVKKIS